MYLVRRRRDSRIVSGIFYTIRTYEEAAAIAARFKHKERGSFIVEMVDLKNRLTRVPESDITTISKPQTRICTMKIGQEIGIARPTRYGYMYIQYGHVVKINGHGHIFVDTGKGDYIKFDKNGKSYKNDYGPSLVDADKLRAYEVAEQKRKTTAELVRGIEQTIKDGWTYSGAWISSDDRIASLKAAIAELEMVG
jgi:hypothetical protein